MKLDTPIINEPTNASAIQFVMQRRWDKPHARFQSHIGF